MESSIPPFKHPGHIHQNVYLPDEGLEAALELALDLGMPLLLTGEPGTGKTQLAHYLARKLGQGRKDLLVFNTKTTSTAKDLLYQYDALTHFRDSQLKKEDLNVMNYISFQALGRAIVKSVEKRYIILIDEIDKAPRDFPNDVLYEFEQLAFKVNEASVEEVSAWANEHAPRLNLDAEGYIRLADLGENTQNRPILILTSNSEKNLPEPFLRRCVFYHIPFPDMDRLRTIVEAKVPLQPDFTKKMLSDAIAHFIEIRENKGLRKKPATAELLAWIHHLQKYGISIPDALEMDSDAAIKKQVLQSYSLIAKTKEDLQNLSDELRLID